MAGRGISGLSAAVAAVGGLLIFTAVRNVGVLDGLRSFAKGTVPAGNPRAPVVVDFVAAANMGAVGGAAAQAIAGAAAPASGSGSGSFGARIVASARTHLGKKYVFGAAGPNVFDCSGLTSYVLKGLGAQSSRLVTQQYLVWGGATTIPRDQCSAGDLVCWSGHIGIALDHDNMINAPHTGALVRIDKIWKVPVPLVRRVKAPASSGTTGVV